MDLHPGEEILFEGHPSWRATLGFYVVGVIAVIIVVLIAAVAGASTVLAVLIAVVGIGAVLVVGLVKRMGTRYVITNQRLHIRRGVLARRIQQTMLTRVQNVNTEQSFPARLLRIGSVDFDTAGTDDSDFTFTGVADPDDVVRAVDRALRSASPAA
ncbi:MAG: hypothetical protein QOH43_4183 [Solirubrobacteraceae bacterium]|jgi:uncharacterized membrane protein YdbT with pleckstrin-like domain|nr:hypothetical protein [Solirubrobacteraceae bacterium]